MKKILVVLFIFFTLNIFATENIITFINKTEKLKKEIEKIYKEYNKVDHNYKNIIIKIENMKESISKSSGIVKNFKQIFLNYYLFKGNKIAYKIGFLRNKLKEFKDDYFTYVVLIIDEYNKKIDRCINEKCAIELLEKIYFERKKWIELLKNYEEILSIEELIPVLYVKKQGEVKDDIKSYYEKKLIQVNQIIFILSEEKEIRKKVVRYGIKSEQEKITEIEDKIKLLNNKKDDIEKQLKIGK